MQKLRAEYWTTIGKVNLADLVFIDEAGVNIAMTRLFARSQKGSRAYGDCPRGSAEGNRPDGRGKNVTKYLISCCAFKLDIAEIQ